MDRDVLVALLEDGRSLAEIGRRLGKHPSTVAYWLKKHGLEARGRERYSAKGPIERAALEALLAEGLPVREIAGRLGRSESAVRRWMARHGLRASRPWRRAPAGRPAAIVRDCRTHGRTRFVRAGADGGYRCVACRSQAVARRRRRVKEQLVAEAGGRCALCGYDRSPAALHFHHRDPGAKAFGIAARGFTRSLERMREEVAKCVLLCANCHAEVEAGVVDYS